MPHRRPLLRQKLVQPLKKWRILQSDWQEPHNLQPHRLCRTELLMQVPQDLAPLSRYYIRHLKNTVAVLLTSSDFSGVIFFVYNPPPNHPDVQQGQNIEAETVNFERETVVSMLAASYMPWKTKAPAQKSFILCPYGLGNVLTISFIHVKLLSYDHTVWFLSVDFKLQSKYSLPLACI